MTFSTLQVAEAAQVSIRQLQFWDERRVIQPSQHGHRRVYEQEDLFKTLLVARLRSKGVSLQRIRALLKSLPLEKLRIQEDAVILVRRRGMRICNEEAAVRAMDLEDGPVWVVAIQPLLAILKKHTATAMHKRRLMESDQLRDVPPLPVAKARTQRAILEGLGK
jgi:DNA-binding transcriptional MerR regulator